MQRSGIGRAWREGTDEYCEVRMTPFRAHGSYRGTSRSPAFRRSP